MLRILVIVFLLLVIYRVVKVRSYKNARRRFADLLDEPEMDHEIFKDPVCGKEVARKDALLLRQGDDVHGFCSEECMRAWQQQHSSGWKM